VGEQLGDKAPKIFQVNWFRKGADGRFLWPGFGDNSRVIDWVIRRVEGEVEGRETAIGTVPVAGELNLDGIEVPEADMAELFAIDPASWLAEADLTEEFFAQFGDRVPAALRGQLDGLRERLNA
jgi:phosphoenolpyruvate carboxykinase (GTP)